MFTGAAAPKLPSAVLPRGFDGLLGDMMTANESYSLNENLAWHVIFSTGPQSETLKTVEPTVNVIFGLLQRLSLHPLIWAGAEVPLAFIRGCGVFGGSEAGCGSCPTTGWKVHAPRHAAPPRPPASRQGALCNVDVCTLLFWRGPGGCPGSHSGMWGVFGGSGAGHVPCPTTGWKEYAPGHAASPRPETRWCCCSQMTPTASAAGHQLEAL